MRPSTFDDLVGHTFYNIRSLLNVKGGEYAPGVDRLANFKDNAKALELNPKQVWAVYAGKHWDAIKNFIVDESQGRIRMRSEAIEGRIDDLIVYLLLLKGLLVDKQHQNQGQDADAVAKSEIQKF